MQAVEVWVPYFFLYLSSATLSSVPLSASPYLLINWQGKKNKKDQDMY